MSHVSRRAPRGDESFAIIMACRNGDLDELKRFHEVMGVDLAKLKNYDSFAPIRDAIRGGSHLPGGNIDVVKYLIDVGCDMQARDCRKRTPVIRAAKSGNVEVLRYLLSKGCNIEDVDEFHCTPLLTAMRCTAKGAAAALTDVLMEARCNIEARDREGRTALINASSKGYLNVVMKLIEGGCMKEASDAQGLTALYVASNCGHVEVVKYLIAAGCNRNITGHGGNTMLIAAALKSDLAVFDYLISMDCRVNERDHRGRTALHRSTERRTVDVAERLIAIIGCDMEIADNDGRTPLHLAVLESHRSIADRLLVSGCNKNSTDTLGCTPLHLAADKGDMRITELLLSYRCDTEVRDNAGRTPAICALMKGKMELVQRLEGSLFEKRLLPTSALTDVPRNVVVYHDLIRLIRCDDAVTLSDGTLVNFKTAQIIALDQQGCDNLTRCDALLSLSCVLRDGESVTLGDGRSLDKRGCLCECLNVQPFAFDLRRVKAEALLYLGTLMQDPDETVTVEGRPLNAVQCIAKALSSSLSSRHMPIAFFYLGSRLKGDEVIAIGNRVYRRRDCFEKAVV